MQDCITKASAAAISIGLLTAVPAAATPFVFSTGSVTNQIATAQATGGERPKAGQEVRFNVTFTEPFDLPADHYFFVPQVLLSDPNQHSLTAAPTATPFDT